VSNLFTRCIVITSLSFAGIGACGSDDPPASTVPTESDGTRESTSDPTTTTTTTPMIDNVWESVMIDPTKLPIGDDSMSTSGPGIGILYSCAPANPNAPGARADGPWLDVENGTWDSTTKLAVEGEVSWPTAKYVESVVGDVRSITSNGLPVDFVTGTFPVAATDPVAEYDRNPGSVSEYARSYDLPIEPTEGAAPACLPLEAVGILRNGVVVYNALDGRGQDAAAHEALDVCSGHPSQVAYHYHSVPSCIIDATEGTSSVVGWAVDGFPIVVERDAAGSLPSNADLDECHGRSSPILIDGEVVTMYHYSATLEFPYTLGCLRGEA
jgi:hypothetical protein